MGSMTDVLPVLIVGANENLIVQAIGRHEHGRHVGWKLEHRRKSSNADKVKSCGQGGRELEIAMSGDDEPPLSERWNIDVIGIGLQTRLLQGFCDAPVGIA